MSNKSNAIDVGWLSQHIGRPTLYNIVYQISRLVERKVITAGALLPTIRQLAGELSISPTTVASAYSELRARNIVQSKRGVGTVVIDNPVTEFPQRFAVVATPLSEQPVLNLSDSYPDPALVPSLKPALLDAAQRTTLNNIECRSMIAELQAALSANWPYDAQSFMAVNNSHEIVSHLLTLFVPPNAYIAIENPITINILDKLRRENVRLIAVERDKDGPVISSLASALAKKPVLFIYQPREHLATGGTVTQRRIAEMAALFKDHAGNTLIVENDIIGDLSGFPAYSIGAFLPEQTLYIRAFLKAYSTDLCFMVASGPERIIQQLYHYRLCNLGWNSQLLQHTLAWLLQDKATARQLKQAQHLYHQRYKALLDALKARKIYLPDDKRPHLFLWLRVPCEQLALTRLEQMGIIACGGSHFFVTPPSNGKEYIRIMTSQLSTPELINRVADTIAFALLTPYPRTRKKAAIGDQKYH